MSVQVFDNVLDDGFLQFINREMTYMSWTIQLTDPDIATEKDDEFFMCDTSSLPSHDFLLEYFNKKYNLQRKKIRSYVNCYPPKTRGTFHPDDGDTTLLFFPHDWKPEHKGSLLFKDQEVKYKKNRLAVFDAKLLHKADVNLSNKMRYTIAWKTSI
tara:strand:- start:159 stop:626 length:468 start_codon:yes stop_codon:yes gene_type:complete